ncbi:hypothetical protein [Pseudoxanthomonas kalamensis]|nr:hypothetical protein [Pseudoxanthomonas kalamensis]
MNVVLLFLAGIGVWLLAWTVFLGQALLQRIDAGRPLSLLDGDVIEL